MNLVLDAGSTARTNRTRVPYIVSRILLIGFVVMMFFPDLTPARFITKAGEAPIRNIASLFTNAISLESVTNGLGRAFNRGWLNETLFIVLFAACLVVLIGVVVAGVGGCMSLGNLPMKSVANKLMLGGSSAMLLGTIGITVLYFAITAGANTDRISYEFPIGIPLFLGMGILVFISVLAVFVLTPKAEKGAKMEMEPKFQLFLALMPFLALVFAFSYLPLYSWRYAFFDYTAGGELTMDKFVGFKWFTTLVQNPAYVRRLLRVLRNTLAMSALGIITSWVPMAFAIFLTEARSARFKRFVQTFTTIPNFISWVLVYAIAFAIFNTDGFINTLIQSFGGVASENYLQSSEGAWLKMLLWGMWKGVGWSAIIYISGIAGIDQQLYEAAEVDGAGRFQKMWNITLPGLLPTFVVMLIMSIAGILSNGMDQYLVFSNANNKDLLEVLDLYVYNLGIGDGSIALSTVVGMTKSIISVFLLFVANTASRLIRGNGMI